MTDLWHFLREPFQFAFMQRALLATLMVSVVSACIGTFVVLKGLAFIGDALAHASFAGVAAAFVMGGNIYLGAVVAALVTALAIALVGGRARVSFDTAIGILFVGAFALGILIVSRQPTTPWTSSPSSSATSWGWAAMTSCSSPSWGSSS